MGYRAPLQDMSFVMRELADVRRLGTLPGFEHADADTVQAVLEENAKLCEDVIAPLNYKGDVAPATIIEGVVTTTPGFKDAFKQFVAGGWQGVHHAQEFGGQGLPKLVASACMEMVNSANMAFALCPLLTDGAIEAFLTAGSQDQKRQYIAPLIDGRWTGTMNLTEPQAGSDLAQVRTKAVPQGDGSYRLFGQKIYITYGEHDLADNIIHLVLARTPDAPEGVKGISLFVVPKCLICESGGSGTRNDVWCASLEHKLGIKASPTAMLIYGDGKYAPYGQEGAVGWLVGEENRGLETMFIMMNAARFAVGVQGIAIAERAYQKAVEYAKERVQSRDVAGSSEPVAIIRHPDVKRMLLLMRSQVEAARALAYWAASQLDVAHASTDGAEAAHAKAVYEYLVPIVKGWSTEMSIDVTSVGVQVHGGMGYIEETGAAQFYRDARILTIYEGTTAIQANDLVGRKTARDGGAIARALLASIDETLQALTQQPTHAAKSMRTRLQEARAAYGDVIGFVVAHYKTGAREVFAGSVNYLKLAGITLGGWQMARALLASQRHVDERSNDAFFTNKIATAAFYAEHVLSQAPALRNAIVDGAVCVDAIDERAF